MLLFEKSQLHATNPGKIMDLRLLLTYRLHAKNIFGINNAASVKDCIRSAIHKLPSWLRGWRTKLFKRLFKYGGQLVLAVRADNVPHRKQLSRHVIVGLWNGGWLPVLGHFSSGSRMSNMCVTLLSDLSFEGLSRVLLSFLERLRSNFAMS